MSRLRTRYVGIDPILLTKTAKPPISEEDSDNFEEADLQREDLMKVFAGNDIDRYMRVIDIANYILDDEAVRRDGFIQQLAQELGVSVGQASRRWKQLVQTYKAFAASLAAFAA
jgi:hypothetical protein